VHAETYGKTGCRRIVPGQFVATDPRGRALMVGAIEKQKLVYILNRDTAARLTISSPLEAHKSNTLTFDIVGVDVGFDNPIFAALEVDTDEANQSRRSRRPAPPRLAFLPSGQGRAHFARREPLPAAKGPLPPLWPCPPPSPHTHWPHV